MVLQSLYTTVTLLLKHDKLYITHVVRMAHQIPGKYKYKSRISPLFRVSNSHRSPCVLRLTASTFPNPAMDFRLSSLLGPPASCM